MHLCILVDAKPIALRSEFRLSWVLIRVILFSSDGEPPAVGGGYFLPHRRWLTITGNQYDPAKHRGIAELYVMDERFTAYYDKQVPGCARFLRDAVVHWVK